MYAEWKIANRWQEQVGEYPTVEWEVWETGNDEVIYCCILGVKLIFTFKGLPIVEEKV